MAESVRSIPPSARDADELRDRLIAMHYADVADLERMPVAKREHGTRLLKALRRQILIDQITGAKPHEADPHPADCGEGLLERLAREATDAPDPKDLGAICPDTTSERATANPAAARASTVKPTRARVTPGRLSATLSKLAAIAARRDMVGLAELEAAELEGPARGEILDMIADVRSQHDRKRDYDPVAFT